MLNINREFFIIKGATKLFPCYYYFGNGGQGCYQRVRYYSGNLSGSHLLLCSMYWAQCPIQYQFPHQVPQQYRRKSPRSRRNLKLDWSQFFWVFTWHNITNDIQVCPICACRKNINHKASTIMWGTKPHRPSETTPVDIMGPYSTTAWGKTNILLVIDMNW